MTESQADKMLAYLEVIALNTTVIAGQTQKGSPLSDEELDQCGRDMALTVQQVLDQQPGPNIAA